jgi:hypothetical protein
MGGGARRRARRPRTAECISDVSYPTLSLVTHQMRIEWTAAIVQSPKIPGQRRLRPPKMLEARVVGQYSAGLGFPHISPWLAEARR